jgi:hypothetical protein
MPLGNKLFGCLWGHGNACFPGSGFGRDTDLHGLPP